MQDLRKGGRPKRPSPESVQKVLNPIRFCSCGKRRTKGLGISVNDFQNILKGVDDACECVGPKSPTDLLRLTKLPRSTLYETLKFLVEQGVLTRTILKKKGHHVRYSITQLYRVKTSKVQEMELTAEYRRNFLKLVRTVSAFARSWNEFERFKRANHQLFEHNPWLENLPPTYIMCLVRLINIYGFEKGTQFYLKTRDTLDGRRFHDFVNQVARGVIDKPWPRKTK